jgi:hypothetical protein
MNNKYPDLRSLSDIGQILFTIGAALLFVPLLAYYCGRAAYNYHQQRQAVASPQYFAEIPTIDDLIEDVGSTSPAPTPAQPQKQNKAKRLSVASVISREMALNRTRSELSADGL